MIKVQDQINAYNTLVSSLTAQGNGLKTIKDPSLWYDYINTFDDISEELKNLHTATYKIDEAKKDSIVNGSDPNEITVPQMINNVEVIDTAITSSYNTVKKASTMTVDAFKSNLRGDSNTLKDIVLEASKLYTKKDTFLGAKLTLVVNGNPQPDPPESIDYNNVTLNWNEVPGAESYIVSWEPVSQPSTLRTITNTYETKNTYVDIAVVMFENNATSGKYNITVAAKGPDLISEPSDPFEFNFTSDMEKIKILSATPVKRDGATDTNPELSNVGKYKISLEEDSVTAYKAKIDLLSELNSHESTAGMGDKKWIGLVIDTNRDVANGVEIKTRVDAADFTALDENEIKDAMEQGAKNRGAFVMWITAEDDGRVITLRHKANPSYTITLTINIIPYTKVIPILPSKNYNNFVSTSWVSGADKVISEPSKELEDGQEITQQELTDWDGIITVDNIDYASMVRYSEIDGIGGSTNAADFNRANIKIDGKLLSTVDGVALEVFNGVDIDGDSSDPNTDGEAYIDNGKTRFKYEIIFARKVDGTWELLSDRLGKNTEYVLLKADEVVGTADGGILPNITLVD